MSFAYKTTALALVGLLVSSTAVYAQAGGGDVPSDAKKQGEKEQPGSTGMSKGGGGGSMKTGGSGGSTGTGGANGGSASKAGADGAGK